MPARCEKCEEELFPAIRHKCPSSSVGSVCSSSPEHWGVDVRVNGEDVLTIESNSMSGKSDLSDMEVDAIRTAAKHLLAFAGQPCECGKPQAYNELTKKHCGCCDDCMPF